jgi:thiamine biosynthesis lipoprotein
VERDKLACVVLVSGSAVATSGTYEKGAHIIDPHTGEPAAALLSFTVVGPDILQTDVFATACFAMGMAGLDFIRKTPGYEAFAIDRQLRAWSTPGFGALRETPLVAEQEERAGLVEAGEDEKGAGGDARDDE